jgi:hypothetical protein
MRKIGLTVFAAGMLLGVAGTAAAHETGDCFPLCAQAPLPEEPPVPLNLCEHAIVREGVRLEQKLRPVREVVNAVQDPAGFVIRQVSVHVVHIPAWVGYAIDPRGAVRAKVMGTLRDELKKSTGLANECRETDYSAMT